MKPFTHITLVCVFSMLGGTVATTILSNNTAKAASEELQRFFDASDVSRLDIGVFNGAPIQDFYDKNGKVRLQFGTYAGAGEEGIPMASLNDSHGRIKMLFRLAGNNESPILIFKDSQGHDRMMLGLSLSDPSEAPFITYTDESGSHNLLENRK